MTELFPAAARLPDISLPMVGGTTTTLDAISAAGNWKLIVIYRGAHCPICASYLKTLQEMQAGLLDEGTEVLAISSDSAAMAEKFAADNALTLPLAHGLTLTQMRALGLYVSEPLGPASGDQPFPEPGLFVLNAQGLVHIVAISNAPFVRPDLAALRRSLRYIRLPASKRHDPFGGDAYPIRGTLLA